MSKATASASKLLSASESKKTPKVGSLRDLLRQGRTLHGAGYMLEAADAYRQVLEKAPHAVEALAGVSMIARQSKQYEAAARMARAAVEVCPQAAILWVNWAQALRAALRFEESERVFLQALALDADNVQGQAGLGELYGATGRHDLAEQQFQLALARDPKLVAAHYGLGNALGCRQDFAGAYECFERAVELAPKIPELRFACGFVLAKMGRASEAIASYRQAIHLRPGFASAWLNLGMLLAEDGREVLAEGCFREAVRMDPALTNGWVSLGNLERHRGRREFALQHFSKAVEMAPGKVETLLALCHFHLGEKNFPEAREWLQRAEEANPGHGEVVNAHGILLHSEERFTEAIVEYERAEELGCRSAISNRANALMDVGRDVESLQAHFDSAERNPRAAGARYNLALTRLRMGDWPGGWDDYEARWNFREALRRPRRFREPRWEGEEIEGRRLLLHAEQGLGDTLQFCRYIVLVVERARGAVIVEAPAELVRLLRVSFPGVEIVQRGTRLPEFDVQCPMMSTPSIFQTSLDTVPWRGPYIAVEEELVAARLERTPELREAKWKIGICWAGNPKYKGDAHRSTRLEELLPMLRRNALQDTWFISLQKGAAAQQLHDLSPGMRDTCRLLDGSSADADFSVTAALVAQLDLIVTTDTSVVHLAGAMGKPALLLLPHLSDWRWMQRLETTPWYPNVRLLRQRSRGDWAELMERAGQNVERFRQSRSLWVE